MEKKINESHKEVKNGKNEEKLSFCMKAPSAEHSRAYDHDEPCDDGRSGEFE